MNDGDVCVFHGVKYIHTGGGHFDQDNRREGLYYKVGSTCCISDDDDTLRTYLVNIYDDQVAKVPTLPQLIEACGNMGLSCHNGRYIASCKHEASEYGVFSTEFCDTPEEAVAMLWLALHANK